MPASHRIIPLFESRRISLVDYRCGGSQRRTEEWPATHEIVLVRAGTYRRRDARGQTIADPNQILLSNKHQPYEIDHPVRGEDRSTVLLVSTSALLEVASAYDASVQDRPEKPFPHSSLPGDPRLLLAHYHLLQTLQEESDPDPLAAEEILLSLSGAILKRVFSERGKRSPAQLPGTASAHAELARQVRMLLNKRLGERLLLEDIASAVYSSPYYLIRIFKAQTGLTIHQYRLRLRLLNAAERIAGQPNENLDRIALDLGFANHSHLTSAFGKAFGLSPSDFRRQSTGCRPGEMRNFLKV